MTSLFIASKIDNRILWLAKSLLAACLFLPLFVSPSLLFPYTASKAFAFRIIVEIAAVFYFYLCLKYRELRPRVGQPSFKKGGLAGILAFVILAFFSVNMLSMIFGVNSALSFWGNLERMGGVFGLAHFILYFFMLTAVFKLPNERMRLIWISVFVSAVVSLLAILQRFASLGSVMPQQERVFGTIGNSAFLAGYLIFNIFLAAYLVFVQSRQRVASGARPRAFFKARLALYGSIIFLQLAAFVFAGTRGALVGLASGLIFCLIFFAGKYPVQGLRKYFLAALLMIFILAGAIFVFRQSPAVKNNALLARFANLSLSDTTTANRLTLWQMSWRAWQDKPVLGWGPENFETAANAYFDQRLNPHEAWYDRAHSFIFDYGVATGWLGLAGFLALIAFILYNLKIISAKGEDDFVFAVLFGGLIVAYLAQGLFVFDSFSSLLMLFLALALISFRVSASESSEAGGKKNFATASVPFVFGKKIIVLALGLAAFYAVYYLNIEPMRASRVANQIIVLPPDRAGEATALAAGALAKNTFASDEIIYQTTVDYISKIQLYPQLVEDEDFYKMASLGLKKSIAGSGEQARYYVALAWLDLYFSDGHEERNSDAINLANQVKKISQGKKDAYILLVAAYSLAGDDEKARDQVAQAETIGRILGEQVKNYYNSINANNL